LNHQVWYNPGTAVEQGMRVWLKVGMVWSLAVRAWLKAVLSRVATVSWRVVRWMAAKVSLRVLPVTGRIQVFGKDVR
jgi:hypothetical protein